MQIGFIGLGSMGYGMISNLLKAGYNIIAFDIDEIKLNSIEKLGAQKTNSIKEVGEVAETVILCLPHPNISKEVLFKKNNLLSSKNKIKTIIDTSTLTPDDVIDMYAKLTKQKIHFLCAPMLGGKRAASDATIHFLVEGNKQVFGENKMLISSMGKRVDYMGKPPMATLAKLAYNMCRYSNLATSVEVTRFIRKYTTETLPFYNLLVEGSLDNFGQVWKEDIKEMMTEGIPYKQSIIPNKDLTLMIQLANKQKLSSKFFKAIRDVYASLI